MKKIASIFLCALFLYNIMGYYTIFIIDRIQIKNEMKAVISNNKDGSSLQKIIIPLSEITKSIRFTEENELIYKGELYDVVKKEICGKNIIISCIFDKKETNLLASEKENFNRNNDQNNSTSSKTSHIIKNIVKEATPDQHGSDLNFLSSLFHFRNYSEHTEGIILPVTSPPPKA